MARISIDDSYLSQLFSKLGTDSATGVTADALTLLNWAAEEVRNGRTILSADASGGDIHKLAMPALLKVQTLSSKE